VVASTRVDLEDFASAATSWLAAHAEPRTSGVVAWGAGDDDVSVFHDLSDAEEAALLQRAMAWQRLKFDAGFGALTWPREHGGAALGAEYQTTFDQVESAFVTPGHHETFSVTLHLVAPTILGFGSHEMKKELIPRFLRTTELCCQLFSEPGAGSDLAGLSTRAVRDGDGWIVSGQKTWSSGARFARWGELICRTDPDVSKHAGLTAFVVPMDAPGITVVPIRQMSGGRSFNEVFFDEVRVADHRRLGAVGAGWNVALTTHGFERRASSTNSGDDTVGGSWSQLLALAQWAGVSHDVVIRQDLARVYTLSRLRALHAQRVQGTERSDGTPDPAGSIEKLLWTRWLTGVGDAAARILGARLTADTGEWGTYTWSKHVLGAVGYRIAGGSDEIQRNIVGERVLGLPHEPRVDRGIPFRLVPHG
jgi:alkylation response protein AidB-like acyl-CoA dehydrogenase